MMDGLQSSISHALKAGEGSGHFVRDYVYVCPSAEYNDQAHIIRMLRKRGKPEGDKRMHVGVAGFFNFDMAAITRPQAILLLDNNRDALRVWDVAIDTLKTCEHPRMFKDRFLAGLDALQREDSTIRLQPRDYMAAYLDDDARWIKNAKAYAHIRDLAMNGAILKGEMDIVAANAAPQQVGQAIRDSGFVIDTAYWSNIGQYNSPYVQGSARGSLAARLTGGQAFTGEVMFGKKGLRYRNEYFNSNSRAVGPQKWDGDDYRHRFELGALKLGKKQRRSAEEYPPYERMLQNISELSSAKTLHSMTSNVGNNSPILLMISDDMERYFGKPHYFEGPPRRTQEQWVQREALRQRVQQVRDEGKGIY